MGQAGGEARQEGDDRAGVDHEGRGYYVTYCRGGSSEGLWWGNGGGAMEEGGRRRNCRRMCRL